MSMSLLGEVEIRLVACLDVDLTGCLGLLIGRRRGSYE
jgi:hypothetical protein